MHPSPACPPPAVPDTPGASGSQGLPPHKCSVGLAVIVLAVCSTRAVPEHLTSMSDTTSLSVPGLVIPVCLQYPGAALQPLQNQAGEWRPGHAVSGSQWLEGEAPKHRVLTHKD